MRITSPLLPKSKAFVVTNLAIKKELKLVDQVGEKNNGDNNDQDGTSDVVTEHIEDEFEEHEELDDELQLATKKTKAYLAHTQRKLGVVIKGH
jgi:hypothetical protein